LENTEGMDKYLDTCHDLPKLSQEDINNLNRSIMSNEIEAVIKIFSQRKDQDQRDLLLNSIRTLKK
jgi:hypothetical protein